MGKKKKPEATTVQGRVYSRQLRGVARMVAQMIKTYVTPSSSEAAARNVEELNRQLSLYSETIGPWAERVALNMVAGLQRRADEEKAFRDAAVEFVRSGGVSQSPEKAKKRYMKRANVISEGLRDRFEDEVGLEARRLIRAQADLIQDIPRKVVHQIQGLAREAHVTGRRDEWLVEKILNLADITRERATTIARTEISRSQAVLDRVDAVSDGITHYWWRTAEDEDVRPEHAKLNGKKFAYDDPPFIPGEGNVHPGEIWNCRCEAEPIIKGFNEKQPIQ